MKKQVKGLIVVTLLLILIGCSNDGNSSDSKRIVDDIDDQIVDQNQSFEIEFRTNGGSIVDRQIVTEGDIIVYPTNPVKDGYVFVRWHKNIELNDPFDKMTPILENLILYAEWNKVEEDDVIILFESDFGDTTAPIVGKPGDSIVKPNDPSDLFHNFLGWKIKGTNEYFDFSIMPNENLSLIAVWEKNEIYEISFYINETTLYKTELFYAGTSVDFPEDPVIDGSVFNGWYQDNLYTIPFHKDEILPSENVSLYAWFIEPENYFYSVTFDTNGGNIIDTQLRKKGESVKEPNTPVRKGYHFEGWYMDETHQYQFNFDEVQNSDITLYAKWDFDETYTITNLIISEEEQRQVVLAQKESFDLPQLFREGYIFDWWYSTENYTVRYRDYLYYAEPLGYELNLYAKWIEAPNMVYVTLDVNGGSEARFSEGGSIIKTGTIQANPGDLISIYNPSREGYTFAGWYYDEDFTNIVMPYSSSITLITIEIPNQDTALYARWVSKTTGQTDDGSEEDNLSLLERLRDFGFICTSENCILEEYQDYNYIFNLDTNELSYIIDVDEIASEGYRYYDRILTINENYDISYLYEVEEDFGFLYIIEIAIEGNYLSGMYNVTHFDSNVTQEQTNYDKAMDFIANIVLLYEDIMGTQITD